MPRKPPFQFGLASLFGLLLLVGLLLAAWTSDVWRVAVVSVLAPVIALLSIVAGVFSLLWVVGLFKNR